MNDETLKSLGKLVADENQQRDAVHIAVVPAVAGEPIAPGEHCYIGSDGRAAPVNLASKPVCKGIGVADPYLQEVVEEGQRFWLFLNPGSITSLRHEWTHPAFPMETRAVTASEAWLRDLCEEIQFSYDRLIETVSKGRNCTGDDEDASYSLNAIVNTPRGEQLWAHLSNVVGRKLEHGYFSCAC